jgi:hypothetical protein
MVEAISSARAVMPALTSVAIPPAGDGRVMLPIRPADALFAAFKHIQVIPDTRLENGVPLYKLMILDNLIEHLAGGAGQSGRGGIKGEASVDSLITELAGKLRARTAGAQSFTAGLLPGAGMVVNLVA